MQRPTLLGILLRYVPVATAAIGIAATAALGWFSYRYVYRTITTAQTSALLQAPLMTEYVDPERVRTVDAFLREIAAFPTIDPSTVRDVFSASGAAPSAQPPATSRPLR